MEIAELKLKIIEQVLKIEDEAVLLKLLKMLEEDKTNPDKSMDDFCWNA